ncbi:MAG TPA: terminase TerL endonuclease subunit [Nitrobacter sp.]|nr:terminase TerL endonuclease subunit [Nitrobacter sp.]
MLVPEWVYDNSAIPDPYGYGERAVNWALRLKHPANPAPGHPFQLDRWQRRVIKRIFGPRYTEDVFDESTGILLHRQGERIVRTVYMRVPRGARKTSLGALCVLLKLCGPERSEGGRIIGAAAAHKQALELFDETKLIINNDKRLRKHLKVYEGAKTSVTCSKFNSKYRAVSSEGKSLHGLTFNYCHVDESHALDTNKGRELWHALDSAMVKIRDTLMIVTTTAGHGTESVGYELDQRAVRIQKGEVTDPSFLPIIFGLENEDGEAWRDEQTWLRVNPGMRFGYPDLASYRIKAEEAKHSPSAAYSFKMYNLCLWQEATTSSYIAPEIYDKGDRPIPDDINGLPCWIGVDMSRTTDLSAVVACVKYGDEFVLLPHFFCPADDIVKRGNHDGVDYDTWSKTGYLTATEGSSIDYEAVKACIRGLCERFDVREVNFDPAYAMPVANPLTDEGYPTSTIKQGYITQSPMLNALEKAFLDGKIIHAGQPVLRWNFMNVQLQIIDAAGSRKIDKRRSKDRIDGVAASWMAVGRAAAVEQTSIYDSPNWSDEMAWA